MHTYIQVVSIHPDWLCFISPEAGMSSYIDQQGFSPFSDCGSLSKTAGYSQVISISHWPSCVDQWSVCDRERDCIAVKCSEIWQSLPAFPDKIEVECFHSVICTNIYDEKICQAAV